MLSRRDLLREAASAAAAIRDATDFDQFSPADPYAAAVRLGVKVTFINASMEGFYFKGSPARILLSNQRPIPRLAFTCGHELGHHWFGHGSTMDQLQADERPDSSKPEEILANGVSSFFLMPTIGLRGSFAKRGWAFKSATPMQIYTVACEFGVGYQTIVNHLAFTLEEIDQSRRKELERWTPQRIRAQLLDEEVPSLLLLDEKARAPTYDVEKGAAILLPVGTTIEGVALSHIGTRGIHDIYSAVRQGTATVSGLAVPGHIRVQRPKYDGAAANRFLEDPDEE